MTDTIQVTNKGARPAQITQISLTGDPAFQLFGVSVGSGIQVTPPFNLPEDRSATLELFFAPTQGRQYSGTVELLSDSVAATQSGGASSCGPSCALALEGTGVLPVPPEVDGIAPIFGVPSGGTPVVINGPSFSPNLRYGVLFDSINAGQVTFLPNGNLGCFTPPHAPGTVSVVVFEPLTQQSSDGGLFFTYCDAGSC